MRVSVDHTDLQAANIATLWFKPEKRVHYTAGQYIKLTLKHDNPYERAVNHWFTLSSAPGNELVSITTKHAGDELPPTGSRSFKRTLFHQEPGAELDMTEPSGDFVLPK